MSRIGAHMSIAGGMSRAVERALAVDATALQVFVKSSNQWAARPFATGEIEAFREAAARADLLGHSIAHASYLLNLASPDDALRARSIEGLRIEVDRCEALAIPLLVLHPGSHTGSGVETGLRRLATALDEVLKPSNAGTASAGSVSVLLETTAGQGRTLGATFEELGWVIDHAASRDRLGVCFDTCHALAAGYEFRDPASYGEMIERFDRLLGLERLQAFHLNDSKTPLGSRVDRHAHIGHGTIGLEAFRLILNDRRFRDVPKVLETPKGEDLAEDRENLAVLRGMIDA